MLDNTDVSNLFYRLLEIKKVPECFRVATLYGFKRTKENIRSDTAGYSSNGRPHDLIATVFGSSDLNNGLMRMFYKYDQNEL